MPNATKTKTQSGRTSVSVPNHVYDRIVRAAIRERRTISAQIETIVADWCQVSDTHRAPAHKQAKAN